jgi:xylulokinase
VRILGVDIGTTGVKAAIVDAGGRLLAEASRTYPLVTPRPGWAELDGDTVWRATSWVVARVCAAGQAPPDAIGITGPGEAFMPLGRSGRPVGAVIVSLDRRAMATFDRVIAQHGTAPFEGPTGLTALPHYALFKWLWWRDQRPEVDRIAVRYASLAGYVAERMGAEPGIDPTLAARTLAFDPTAGAWSRSILNLVSLDPDRLPPLVGRDVPASVVSRRVAARWGMGAGIPIELAGLDQSAAAAAVELDPGAALLSVGTTAVVAQHWERVPAVETRLPWVPDARRGGGLVIAGSPGGGSSLRWARSALGLDGRGTPRSLDALVDAAANRSTSVIFLPHLGGSRTALDDPGAEGAFVGLTFAADQSDLIRAILDGVAYEIAQLADRLVAAGGEIRSFVAVGGASRSRGWMGIVADASDRPVASTESSEAAAYGAARIAAGRIGRRLPPLHASHVSEPRAAWRAYHDDRRAAFLASHGAIRTAREQVGSPSFDRDPSATSAGVPSPAGRP